MQYRKGFSIRSKLFLAFGIVVVLNVTLRLIGTALTSHLTGVMARMEEVAVGENRGINIMTGALDILQTRERTHSEPPNEPIDPRVVTALSQFESGLETCIQVNQKKIWNSEEENGALTTLKSEFPTFKASILRDPDSLPVTNRMATQLYSYSAEAAAQMAANMRNIRGAFARNDSILLGLAIGNLLIAIILAYFLSRSIVRPIGVLRRAAEQIGGGDLSAPVELRSRDELGLLAATFNQMIDDLRSKTVSKDYVESILQSMVNTVTVVNTGRIVQSVNQAALDLLGYAEEDLIGQSMDKFIRMPAASSSTFFEQVLKKGLLNSIDANYETQSGKLIPVLFSASVLRNSGGAITGVVCVAQDVSERKKAEHELEQANKQLLETSRQAGMAEVATSVLHNVGNVLNSVNVSSAIISEKVQNSKIANLAKATALMEAHEKDLPEFFSQDPKGKQLPGYLSKLAVNLGHEQKEILQEVASLVSNIVHIKEIVAMQQNYARVSGISELLDIKDLMEDAVRINLGALERHQVKLIREFHETPPVMVEKHKVLQILVNLVRNAKHACDDSGRSDKQMTLRVANGDGRVKVSVTDNGIGIPEKNMSRIFSHGFTTKKEGHGFGLHSGALAAREMGGTLTVFSEGPGQGSTFTLELPIQTKDNL
jgi:PAS domain S-box-containing protein